MTGLGALLPCLPPGHPSPQGGLRCGGPTLLLTRTAAQGRTWPLSTSNVAGVMEELNSKFYII